jgi:peptidoglycan/LPS O-acetylase OafA/YrhL
MYFSTITRIDCLALGALGASLIDLGVSEKLLRWFVRLALPAALLCLAVIIVLDPLRSMWENLPMIAVGLSATGLAALSVLLHVVIRPCRPLRQKPLRLLGKYSYGLYLYHYPVIVATNWLLGYLGIVGVAYALWFGSVVPLLTAALALLSWHHLEMRFLSLKAQFS